MANHAWPCYLAAPLRVSSESVKLLAACTGVRCLTCSSAAETRCIASPPASGHKVRTYSTRPTMLSQVVNCPAATHPAAKGPFYLGQPAAPEYLRTLARRRILQRSRRPAFESATGCPKATPAAGLGASHALAEANASENGDIAYSARAISLVQPAKPPLPQGKELRLSPQCSSTCKIQR